MTTYWTCVGTYPHVDPCGAHGEGDKGAERHTKQTGHGTSTSLHPPVVDLFGEAAVEPEGGDAA